MDQKRFFAVVVHIIFHFYIPVVYIHGLAMQKACIVYHANINK